MYTTLHTEHLREQANTRHKELIRQADEYRRFAHLRTPPTLPLLRSVNRLGEFVTGLSTRLLLRSTTAS
jgi:hypothetical protein